MRQAAIRFNTANLSVFDLVLRHADREGSDLDLIVDPLPSATLLDLGGLPADLEQTPVVQVDLLTRGDLSLKFRAEVLSQAQPARTSCWWQAMPSSMLVRAEHVAVIKEELAPNGSQGPQRRLSPPGASEP